MFCSNQIFSINGEHISDLKDTLSFVLRRSGYDVKTYKTDPIKGVILYCSEKIKHATLLAPEMKTETIISEIINNYLNSDAVKDTYKRLAISTVGGDSWFHNGWETYVPQSTYIDEAYGIPSEELGWVIIGFKPALIRYDK